MDSKRFEKAHARALARRNPLVPPSTFDAPFASHELVAVEHDSDCLASL